MQQFTRVPSSLKAIDGHLGVPAMIATCGWLLSNPHGYQAPHGGIKAQLKRYFRKASRFEQDWKVLCHYHLSIAKAPCGENRFQSYYSLSWAPSDKPHPIRYLTARQGLALARKEVKYQEPAAHYIAVPVDLLRDKSLSAAAKTVVMLAIKALTLQTNAANVTASKQMIQKASGVSSASFEAAWVEAKQSGWIRQTRLLNEVTGKIEWAYSVAASSDEVQSVAAHPKVERKTATKTITDADGIEQVASAPEERAVVESVVRENLDCAALLAGVHQAPLYYTAEDVEGYVRMITDTVCTTAPTVRIGREELSADTVRIAFMSLRFEDIIEVMTRLQDYGEGVHNRTAYKRTALYNVTMARSDEFLSAV